MKKINASSLEWFVVLGLYVCLCIRGTGFIAVWGPLIVSLLLCVILKRGNFNIHFDGYHIYIILFGLFCYASSLWAQNSSYAIIKGNLIIKIYIAVFTMSMVFSESRDINSILNMIKWGDYFLLAYAVFVYGWDTFIDVIQNSTRISGDYINANVLGMSAAYAIVINLYFIFYDKIRWSDLFILPALIILIASGSRKALIIIVAGALGVIVLRNFRGQNILNSIFRILPVVIVFLIILLALLRLPIFSNLVSRMEDAYTLFIGEGTSKNSGWLRWQYYQLGGQIFVQHPALGIGIDNARIYTSALYGYDHYLHCNYVELLACGGIVGTVLYYSIYVYILYIMIKYRNKRDKEWDICFILIIIRLAIDIAVVSYESPSTYVYLLLFWMEARKLKGKRPVQIRECVTTDIEINERSSVII